MNKFAPLILSLFCSLILCGKPVEARGFIVDPDGKMNLHGFTKFHGKTCGADRQKILGGPGSMKTFQDVEKASTSFPPYIIQSKNQGERIPRVHIRFVATPQNQNQHYKDGKPKPRPKQGGKRQKPYYTKKKADENLDSYIPGDEFRVHVPVMGIMVQGSEQETEQENEQQDVDELYSGPIQAITGALAESTAVKQKADRDSSPQPNFEKGKNGMRGGAQGAGEAFGDAFNPAWESMLELHLSHLLNVANESAGQPCSAKDPVKVHENAIWMVMQMYKRVYLQIALLLILPGAVLSQMKGLVSSGILQSQNDEDAVSPFVGIQKSLVAIFLIPATQLIVSYAVDIGNSMTYEVKRHINEQLIYEWADEQVFRAPEANKKEQIMHPSMFKVLGKLSEGSEKDSGVEPQSEATVMLQTLVNLSAMSAAFGLVMLSAFQITMMCYLLLFGPIAAAFFAWPTAVGSLFSRIFAVWVDGVINVGLWRFWWSTVLLAAQTRIEWLQEIGQYNPYCEWEMIIFVAFIVILMYVPFNPFDFKAGEMVSQIMSKSEMAVSEATQKGAK
ncbi:MAG: hypothetical protein IPG59_00120 [Candidatus Melainabacteria bacterium]|nr:MAG: hypothetical protein IPG59_00120 [Candidatus Melainabacteria bacterium]